MSLRRTVAALAARQNGVFTVAQARAAGVSQHQLRDLKARGECIPIHPGVLRVVETPLTPAARIRAVYLWAGPPSWITGWAAAFWWGFVDRPPPAVTLAIPRNRRLRSTRGVIVARREVPPEDQSGYGGIGVTCLALTVLQAAVEMGPAGPTFLDRALQRVGYAAVRAAHYRNLGCHGSMQAGRLLIAAADGAAAASERLLVRHLKAAAIRGWRLNHEIWIDGEKIVIDLAFVEERVAVEVDGWAWHHTPERFQRDRTRQNALTRSGWSVLRFTWFDLTQRPAQVIAEIRAAVGQ